MISTTESVFALARNWSSAYRKALGQVSRDSSIALVDQGIVSGSRFVTTILIGRFCGAQQLGEFALAFQLSMLLVVAMEAVISTPYIIFCNRYDGKERTDYAGSALLHSAGLAGVAMALLALAAVFMSAGPSNSDFSDVIWILLAITPFIVLREFGRRFAFAHLQMGTAMLLDLVNAVLQITAIIWLASAGLLSATTALWAVGVAAGLSGIGWLVHEWRSFTFRFGKVIPDLVKNWTAGRWLFGSSVVASGTDTSIYWILAFSSGLTATGIFAACMTVVQLSNPVLLGLGNVLQPATAKAYHDDGIRAVKRIVKNGQLALGALMTVYLLAVILVGADVIAYLYQGAEYSGQEHTVIVLGLFVLVSALELSPNFGLRILEKTRPVFFIKVLETGVILTVIFLLAKDYGVLAIVYGLLSGAVVATIILSLMLFRTVDRPVKSVTESRLAGLENHK
ncbi:MAG: lipopolysaccharide biosynthesis protein [Woeseia sp.]|nr:lipopolysaccharide biosynthesis protein [Woeseia sp.]